MDSSYCPHCGTEVPEGAGFCPNCGRAVSQEEAPRQAQQTSSATMAPTEQVPKPPQTQQQSVFTPPQASPSGTPGGGGPRRGLLLGGLAVASVLGFVALLVVGALLYFFAFGPGPEVVWTNGNLEASAVGTQGTVADFFNSVGQYY